MTDIGAVGVNISNYQEFSPDLGKGKISPILVDQCNIRELLL
jgi:hypothetical protein